MRAGYLADGMHLLAQREQQQQQQAATSSEHFFASYIPINLTPPSNHIVPSATPPRQAGQAAVSQT